MLPGKSSRLPETVNFRHSFPGESNASNFSRTYRGMFFVKNISIDICICIYEQTADFYASETCSILD